MPPGSSIIDTDIFKCKGNPFIETSLMNVLELLLSPTVIHRIQNIKQLLMTYSFVIQSMITLNRYEIKNLEKVNSFIYLAFSISNLFANNQALNILKQINNHSTFSLVFETSEDIRNYIIDLNNMIYEHQCTVNSAFICHTLSKLQNELLRNWSIENINQFTNILEFIDHYDLWRYSAKYINLIDEYLELSQIVKESDGLVSIDDEYDEINQYLNEVNDSTNRLEILLCQRIYTQLIFDQASVQSSTKVLNVKFEQFKKNLHELKVLQTDQRLERICLIAWLRYYLSHYLDALQKDAKDKVMNEIDQVLVGDDLRLDATVQLYLIKQLCSHGNRPFDDLCKQYSDRNVVWIRSWFDRQSKQKLENARKRTFLPTPMFEYLNEFKHVDQILSTSITSNESRNLLDQCSTKATTAYCFLLWFIHDYTRFYMSKISSENQFAKLIENKTGNELTDFIRCLCQNFHEKTYFCLDPFISNEKFHQRLIVLNIIALFISFRSKGSTFDSLMFDKRLQMSYNQNEIKNQSESNMTIFRCSTDCSWLFYRMMNTNSSNEPNQCPICKREMNASRPPIQISKQEALELITSHIEQYKDEDNSKEKSLTHYLLKLISHSIYYFLHQFNEEYFQQQIEIIYTSIREHLSDIDQWYIWLYKLFNHMFNKDFEQLQINMENELIMPHLDSIVGEIREYKLAYVDFVYGDEKKNNLFNFVEELIEDNNIYPFIQFFNVTNIQSIDILHHFHTQLQIHSDYNKAYPLTTFVLKHLSEYDNIQYLYPIVRFMNYLIEKFDYRLERTNEKKLKTIIPDSNDDSSLKLIYEEFLNAWLNISLKEVSFNGKKYPFLHIQSKYVFENQTNISMFLLNKSNDEKHMLGAACLQTLSELQNGILNYFHSNVMIYSTEEEGKHSQRTVPIQSIQKKHLFNFGTEKFKKFLVDKALTINYRYGMSREIIYDYDEIERVLRNEISRLSWIDSEDIQYFHYQGELCDENSSLISEIRTRFQQKLFDQLKRNEIQREISSLGNDTLHELSGSLEYILAYLRNVKNKNIFESMNIRLFIDQYIHSKSITEYEILRKEIVSSIQLKYIIDFYELVEECIFDNIVHHTISHELRQGSRTIVDQFIDIITNTQNLADCFKDFDCWIDMFKRLLVRTFLPKVNINLDSPLLDYVKRSDVWKGNITAENIRTIDVNRNICLKHAFVILEELIKKQEERRSMNVYGDSIGFSTTRTNPRSSNSAKNRQDMRRRNNLR